MDTGGSRNISAFDVTHRLVLSIAIPMTLGFMTTPLLGITNTAVVGHMGDPEALAGLRQPVAGSIVLQGADVTQATPRQLAACGVAHIPEDRHKHGMVEGYTIADNLVLNTYYQQPFAHWMVRRAAAR